MTPVGSVIMKTMNAMTNVMRFITVVTGTVESKQNYLQDKKNVCYMLITILVHISLQAKNSEGI